VKHMGVQGDPGTGVIYFDNAATSWPKPEATLQAMDRYLRLTGGSPGRSGHRLSIEAGRIVFDTRDALAELFGIADSSRIVFAKNATEALNLAISGLLGPGDHAICSGMEHNSVMRPLNAVTERGVEFSIVPCAGTGELDPRVLANAIRKNTRAVYLTHASNVTGCIMPVAEVGAVAREHGLIFCVDAAQTAGALPIDVAAMNVDLLAFTGHKSLFGPPGTGGLYIGKGLEDHIRPILRGGTGSRSESEYQPDFLPDKYESGTPNTVGLAGLGAGVRFVLAETVGKIRAQEHHLTSLFLEGMAGIPGVKIYGPESAAERIPVISFSMEGRDPAQIALELDEEFGIMSRPGLHCSPRAHQTIGTYPTGTVRFSFGYFNTEDQLLDALAALAHISRR
jgi:cysteine desulfurase family protein